MKNRKKIIISVITLGIVIISGISIYYSRQGLTQIQENKINDDQITDTSVSTSPTESIPETTSTGIISYASSTNTTIQDCWDTDFGTSNMYTPSDKQRNCALLTLATAKSIKINEGKVGDFYTLSDIKALATDATTSSNSPADLESDRCWKAADSNAAMIGCAYSGEKSLQDVIRSLVKMNIDKEKAVSFISYDTDPAFYADQMKTEWQDWYVSITSEYSPINTRCTLETDRDVFGGSITPLYKSGCFIKQDAIEILWLIDRVNEIRQDRTPQ